MPRWSSGTRSARSRDSAPLEEDERADQGFTRRLTFPFRLTEARAGFEVPLPSGRGPGARLAHGGTSGRRGSATRDRLDPRRTPRRRRSSSAPTPAPGPRFTCSCPARVAARGAVRVGLATTTWRDPYRGRRVGLQRGRPVGARRAPRRGPPPSRPRSPACRRSGARRTSSSDWWVAAPEPVSAARASAGDARLRRGRGPARARLVRARGLGQRSARCAGPAAAPRRISATRPATGRLRPRLLGRAAARAGAGRLLVERLERTARAPAGEAAVRPRARTPGASSAVPLQAPAGPCGSRSTSSRRPRPAGPHPRTRGRPRPWPGGQAALAGRLTGRALRGSADRSRGAVGGRTVIVSRAPSRQTPSSRGWFTGCAQSRR